MLHNSKLHKKKPDFIRGYASIHIHNRYNVPGMGTEHVDKIDRTILL